MEPWCEQSAYGLRFDWGLNGADAIANQASATVVVDVLSFTTTLSVALDVGTAVLPYRWNDETAKTLAREADAVLAVGRGTAAPGQISLSPGTLRTGSAPARLVLPSPNGSTLAHYLGGTPAVCLGASLRNGAAVADWIASTYDPVRSTIAVIATGEQWPDGGMRPAVEDLWGAGLVLDHLAEAGWLALSPEAAVARAAWQAVADQMPEALLACVSGRELVDQDYREDVEIAAEVSTSRSVPYLRDGEFVPAPPPASGRISS